LGTFHFMTLWKFSFSAVSNDKDFSEPQTSIIPTSRPRPESTWTSSATGWAAAASAHRDFHAPHRSL
jgi:hypothetical protein